MNEALKRRLAQLEAKHPFDFASLSDEELFTLMDSGTPGENAWLQSLTDSELLSLRDIVRRRITANREAMAAGRLLSIEQHTSKAAASRVIKRMRAHPGGSEAFLRTATQEELGLIAHSGAPEENALFDAMTLEELQEVAIGATPERWAAIQAAARSRARKGGT